LLVAFLGLGGEIAGAAIAINALEQNAVSHSAEGLQFIQQ
jgi:hypothetical protein